MTDSVASNQLHLHNILEYEVFNFLQSKKPLPNPTK